MNKESNIGMFIDIQGTLGGDPLDDISNFRSYSNGKINSQLTGEHKYSKINFLQNIIEAANLIVLDIKKGSTK